MSRIKRSTTKKRKIYKILGGQAIDAIGLKAWWKLDSSAFDYSLNGNDGAITNAVPAYPGYSFDGATGLINCGSGATIDDIFVGGGTAAWWQRSDGRGENNLGYAIEKNFWYVGMITDTTHMIFKQVFTGSTNGAWTFPITAGVWQHIAVVYDNDNRVNNPVVYVNGGSVTATETGTPDGDTDTSDGAASFYIGNVSSDSRTWDGSIGDVTLYNVTKTAAQIKNLFNQTRSKYSV